MLLTFGKFAHRTPAPMAAWRSDTPRPEPAALIALRDTLRDVRNFVRLPSCDGVLRLWSTRPAWSTHSIEYATLTVASDALNIGIRAHTPSTADAHIFLRCVGEGDCLLRLTLRASRMDLGAITLTADDASLCLNLSPSRFVCIAVSDRTSVTGAPRSCLFSQPSTRLQVRLALPPRFAEVPAAAFFFAVTVAADARPVVCLRPARRDVPVVPPVLLELLRLRALVLAGRARPLDAGSPVGWSAARAPLWVLVRVARRLRASLEHDLAGYGAHISAPYTLVRLGESGIPFAVRAYQEAEARHRALLAAARSALSAAVGESIAR